MIKKTVFSFIGIVVLVIIASTAYYLYYQVWNPVVTAPQATPDMSVIAGPIVALSAKSISVQKLDGSVETLALSSSTQVTMVGQNNSATKSLSDLAIGVRVLITPAPTASATAQSIIILPTPPPAQ